MLCDNIMAWKAIGTSGRGGGFTVVRREAKSQADPGVSHEGELEAMLLDMLVLILSVDLLGTFDINASGLSTGAEADGNPGSLGRPRDTGADVGPKGRKPSFREIGVTNPAVKGCLIPLRASEGLRTT